MTVFVTLYRLLQGYALIARLKRHGALDALKRLPFVPMSALVALKVVTFFIPRRAKVAKTEGERLSAAFAAMGPAYIKLGQTLAMRPDLVGRDIAEGLSSLQDRLAPFAFKDVRRQIESALGDNLDALFASLDETPVAAASIAQVHKAVLHDGRTVAVKVLRPGIERRFQRDLAFFQWLADTAQKRNTEARRLRLKEVAAKVRETCLRETDLRLEASAANELARNMAGEEGYRIPEMIWSHTGASVLCLEWIDGVRFSDTKALEAAGHDLIALSRRIVQVFLKQAMRDGYFHADLHRGNLLVKADGTIAAVDFGIMGRLPKSDRRFLAEILYGFIQRDYHRVAQVHFDAGYVPASQNLDDFAQALRAIADPIMDLPVNQISAAKLLAQLFATTERFSMQAQPQLIVLQRTMMMSEGLALHLNPSANLWEVSRPVLEDWMRDNLSPEVQLADFIKSLPQRAERISRLLDGADALVRMANTFETAGTPNSAAGHMAGGDDQPARGTSVVWPLLVGLLVGVLVGAHGPF